MIADIFFESQRIELNSKNETTGCWTFTSGSNSLYFKEDGHGESDRNVAMINEFRRRRTRPLPLLRTSVATDAVPAAVATSVSKGRSAIAAAVTSVVCIGRT
jgi:hypothetical protein